MDPEIDTRRTMPQILKDALSLIFQNTFCAASLGILGILALAISLMAAWNSSQKGLQISLSLVHGLVLPMFLAFGGYKQNDPEWSWWINRGLLSPKLIMALQLLNIVAYSLLCTLCLVAFHLAASLILQRPWEIAFPFSLLKASASSCIPVFSGMLASGITGKSGHFRNTAIGIIVLLPALHSLAQGSEFQNLCELLPNLLVNYKEQKDTVFAWFLGGMLAAYLSSSKIR